MKLQKQLIQWFQAIKNLENNQFLFTQYRIKKTMLSKLKNKIHILQNIYLKNKYFIKKKTYSMDGEDLAIAVIYLLKINFFYKKYILKSQ